MAHFTFFSFFFQAEDGIRDSSVTGVQTCALPICYCCLHLCTPIYLFTVVYCSLSQPCVGCFLFRKVFLFGECDPDQVSFDSFLSVPGLVLIWFSSKGISPGP